MPKAPESVDQIRDFLDGTLPLEQLEDWSARYSWDIHKRNVRRDERALVYQIRSILNEHGDDETENVLRQELEAAIRPFEKKQPQKETSFSAPSGRIVVLSFGSGHSLALGYFGAPVQNSAQWRVNA